VNIFFGMLHSPAFSLLQSFSLSLRKRFLTAIPPVKQQNRPLQLCSNTGYS